MSLRSRLGMDDVGRMVALAFYALVGVICLSILAMIDLRLIHVGMIGILSLTAAYGLFKSRTWVVWIVIALFFVGTTFSAYTLYSAFQRDLLLDLSMIFYLLLTWIFTLLTLSRRRSLES